MVYLIDKVPALETTFYSHGDMVDLKKLLALDAFFIQVIFEDYFKEIGGEELFAVCISDVFKRIGYDGSTAEDVFPIFYHGVHTWLDKVAEHQQICTLMIGQSTLLLKTRLSWICQHLKSVKYAVEGKFEEYLVCRPVDAGFIPACKKSVKGVINYFQLERHPLEGKMVESFFSRLSFLRAILFKEPFE